MEGCRQGAVRWFDPSKAYGFIVTEDGRDVFVHRSALGDGRSALVPGQGVTLGVRQGPKGLQATEVRVVQEAPPPPPEVPAAAAEGATVAGIARPRPPREPYRGPLPGEPLLARVRRIDAAGRYLFARVEGQPFDVFVLGALFSRLGVAVHPGQRIWVEVESTERGPRATSFRLAEPPAPSAASNGPAPQPPSVLSVTAPQPVLAHAG